MLLLCARLSQSTQTHSCPPAFCTLERAQAKYVPSFYNNSLLFLEVTCGVLGFQALFGTFFVIYYGLCTATREAGSHLVSRDPDDHEPLVAHH